MKQLLSFLLASVGVSCASRVNDKPLQDAKAIARVDKKSLNSCANTPDSRHCWGEVSVDTNYITTIPDTGHTVEVWLSAEEAICSPDGFERTCMTFNGTMPGPPIIANWGDELIVHVSNNMPTNGTTVHFHGVRQLDTVAYDGVPGVTQCPIPPGGSMTYKFKVTQYGSSWEYSEGLFGALIFNGPATANYDEDLGALFLQDWSHQPIFTAWHNKQKYGITHSLNNLLINGTNTFDCAASPSERCIGGGKKSQIVFQAGKKYLIRLVNVATDSQFQFSIDGHNLTVIANDFVPIKPFVTDSVILNGAQRYDIVVEANAGPGDYWLRALWVNACAGVANDHPENSTAIIRYDAASTKDPTTVSVVQPPKICSDEPLENLEPHLSVDVTNIGGITVEELRMRFTHEALFTWTINSSSLVLDWSNPTLKRVSENNASFPTELNVVSVDKQASSSDEWAVLVIENKVIGLLAGISHPIHLHGHDFWILAQESSPWDGTANGFKTANPPRRDTAVLPANGHLTIAFRLDNPGVWLLHCHIAWHASQGLSMQFVERANAISVKAPQMDMLGELCSSWDRWAANATVPGDGSGI